MFERNFNGSSLPGGIFICFKVSFCPIYTWKPLRIAPKELDLISQSALASQILESLASRLSPQTQIIRVEEEKEKVESELLRQARDLEMLQNTIQKSQRERENMQSEMEVLLDRINKMSDMLDKSRVQRS